MIVVCLFVFFFNIYKIEVFDCLVASRDLGLRLNTVGDKSKARKLCEMPKVPKSVTSHEPEAWPRGSQFSSVWPRVTVFAFLTLTVGICHLAAIHSRRCVLFCRAIRSCSFRRLAPLPAWVLVSHFKPSFSWQSYKTAVYWDFHIP